jgi:hypothetical protein
MRETITRSFDCEGMCGEVFELPLDYSRIIAYANGTLRPGVHLLCDDCAAWIERIVEEAHATVKP